MVHVNPLLNTRFRFQILAAITVHMLTFSHGIGLGWLSPTLRLLQSPETPLDFVVSIDESSWIGSFFGLGMLMGNIVFGFLLDKLGRKPTMYLLTLPHILFWLLVYFAKSVEYLYIARFSGGITSGGIYIAIPIYISEISDISIRGALSSLLMFFVCSGIMVGFVLGSHLSYFVMPCIVLALPILFMFAFIVFPETPQYLLRNAKLEAAEKSFAFYKHSDVAPLPLLEQTPEKRFEFDEFKTHILHTDQTSNVTLKDFVNGPTIRTFITAFMLIMLNQLSGSFAIINYMSGVFVQSGSTMDPNACTIIIGLVQIVGTTATTLLVDRYGRKLLLITSVGGMATGMFAFGAYTQFTPADQLAEYSWVALVLITIIIFTASWGLISVIFTIIVEILPAKIRSKGISICMAFMSCMVFVALKLYPYFLYELGITITMYSCAAVCVVGGIYHFIFLSETKGKSMDHD